VKPEYVSQCLDAARENARHARNEPGCLRFDIIQDREDPNCFRLYEIYRDDAALAVHRETAHFKRYIETTTPWLASPTERRLGLLIND
jgi:(4S)-4-hydroxy-5-phosphonooxypentane-2,3-dione isomerase